ncbi:GTPase Era, mitochondrial [Thalassophryne amazonica]|uniref:GTPase Era, mitochondrial n=1 Tax=Thalassophryne amazonica TaxID=390379 RepID=UPI001471635E|nr:GTPase Era, mitochondrial [Thalassophryne amazonica]
MAFRLSGRIFRHSTVFSGRVVSARQEPPSWFLTAGSCEIRHGRNGFNHTPACFITSEVFLSRLVKGRVAQADGSCDRIQPPASVLPDSGENLSLLVRHPDQPENSKVIKVAIIGSPNVGKSTLTNQLLGTKVFAVSNKVHTTRSRSLGVLTEDDTQIILLDTPGVTSPSKVKRHHLEKSIFVDPRNTMKEADLIVAMVDVADRWMRQRLDFEMLKCLAQNPDIPAVLVLNKVDQVKKKDRLLEATVNLTCGLVNGRKIHIRPVIKPPWAERMPVENLDPSELSDVEDATTGVEDGDETKTALSKEQLKALWKQQGWPHFKDVFMLSSTNSEEVETLKNYLKRAAKPGAWQYHSQVLTDQTPEEVCLNTIREKLLEHLNQEVPYAITQSIQTWEQRETGELDICVELHIKKDSHMSVVIGAAGQKIAQMAQEATEDLSQIFLRHVRLKLIAKLQK